MKTRVISGLVAVILVIAIYLLWRSNGLLGICAFGGLGCIYEYSRLTLARAQAPLHIRVAFFLFAAALLMATAFWDLSALHVLTLVSVVFMAMSLTILTHQKELETLWQIQSMAILGFVYVGIFPAMALRMVRLEHGDVWLLGLLAIVFSGDTLAYLVGRSFGKRKLLEAASPNKTVEGACGGLLGSGLAGFVIGHYFLPEIPIVPMIVLAILTGAFAQAGDLFESTIKRVADVKDSGRIMPGHGGFMDRLDGVLFAAPVLYVLSRLLVATT